MLPGAMIDRLFFAHDGDALRDATKELDAVAAAVSGMEQPTEVIVIGFADEAEPGAVSLAWRRAQVVREALIARGVPPSRIAVGVGRSSSVGPPSQDQRAEIRLRNR